MSQLFFQPLYLGLYLFPERRLWRLLAAFDDDRNHLLDSRDIDAGTLWLTALAIGDRPVDDLWLEAFLDAEKVLARHLTEWFLYVVGLPKGYRSTSHQPGRDNNDSNTV